MEGQRKKVLLIDDDEDILELLKEKLQSNNFDCRTATLSAEGLNMASEFKPDLVLLDLMLPKMSGHGFMIEFKNRPELARTPVVILTSLRDDDVAQEMMSLGASGYLTKACSTRELLSTVREYI